MNETNIKQMVRRCMNHLKRKDYELGITKSDVDRAVRITTATKTGCGWGGANSIKIPLKYWQCGNPRYKEYDSFNKCPVIGGREVADDEQIFWLIVAHEVSHHVQHSRGRRVRWLKSNWRKSHGQGFRTIYALVRSGLINPMLDAAT